jgi:hypothetical protein
MESFGSEKGYRGNNDYTASGSVFDVARLSWKSGIAYVAAILFILLGILLLVHYTLYPIFQFQPGGKGLIPIPGFKDNKTFWPPASSQAAPIQDISDIVVFSNSNRVSSNWAFTLDICIVCPMASILTTPESSAPITPNSVRKTAYRLIFNRGGTYPAQTTGDMITGVVTGYNVAIALVPDTTDLIVSVLDSNGNPVNATIYNAPVQAPFRIGVVLMDMAFEVYLNGKLVQTMVLSRGINSNIGFFQGPQKGTTSTTDMMDIVRVGNLNVWSRTAQPAEIRYAQPTLMATLTTDSQCSVAGASACPTLAPVEPSGETIAAPDTAAIAAASAALTNRLQTGLGNILPIPIPGQ